MGPWFLTPINKPTLNRRTPIRKTNNAAGCGCGRERDESVSAHKNTFLTRMKFYHQNFKTVKV
jgi:hypothetical protein